MRVPSGWSGRRGAVGANMTPMIDVVFLLIIFFLVSSHLARQETRLPLDLPEAATSGPLDPERSALTVSIDPEGNWRVGGNVVTLETLSAILADHADRERGDAAVRVRTDRSVAYGLVEPLLRTLAKAGIADVSISVRREEPK